MAWASVGTAELRTWLLVQTWFSKGCLPLSIDIRDGTQIGEGQYAFSSRTPSAARASRLGVRASGSPQQPATNGLC